MLILFAFFVLISLYYFAIGKEAPELIDAHRKQVQMLNELEQSEAPTAAGDSGIGTDVEFASSH